MRSLKSNKLEFAPANFNKQADWAEAVLYCQFLDFNDHRDWRLPTNYEIQAYLPEQYKAVLLPIAKDDFSSYWGGPMWYDLCWASDDKGSKRRLETDMLYVIPVRDV